MTQRFKDQTGFTLPEVLVGATILSIGILAITSLSTTTIKSNFFSRELTQATTLAGEKMEEIRHLATNEPQTGVSSLGFGYLISASTGGYLASMYDNGTNGDSVSGDGIYTNRDTSGKTTRSWSLEPYPSGGSNPTFATPVNITAVKVTVTCQWVDMTGVTRSVQLQSLIHRRQFAQ